MDALLEHKPLLIGIGVAVVALIAIVAIMASKKKDSGKADPFGMGKGRGKGGKSKAGAPAVKAKVVWIESSEGPFDTAFDYASRKEIKNSKLRYHMQTIVEAWAKRKCGGVIVKHPSGRDLQVLRFKGGQKVSGKPFLAVDFVSYTSDRRRTMLFLDGAKMEEIECDNVDTFELARKNILEYTESGRKTCPLSNLAFRQTFVAPISKED